MFLKTSSLLCHSFVYLTIYAVSSPFYFCINFAYSTLLVFFLLTLFTFSLFLFFPCRLLFVFIFSSFLFPILLIISLSIFSRFNELRLFHAIVTHINLLGWKLLQPSEIVLPFPKKFTNLEKVWRVLSLCHKDDGGKFINYVGLGLRFDLL